MSQLDPSRYKRLTKPLTYGSSDGLYWDGTNSRPVYVVGGTVYEAPLSIASQVQGDMLRRGASTWERLAAVTAGALLVGDGTDLTAVVPTGDVTITGAGVTAIGAAKVLSAMMEAALLRWSGWVTIPSADIVSTAAGKLSHANGQAIVAAPGAGYAMEFVSGIIINDMSVAAYTGGGNTGFAYTGGTAAVSGVVTAANSIAGAGDKVAIVYATVPANNQVLTNTGISLVTASAYTQPGTAAGVARVGCWYRIHTTGL